MLFENKIQSKNALFTVMYAFLFSYFLFNDLGIRYIYGYIVLGIILLILAWKSKFSVYFSSLKMLFLVMVGATTVFAHSNGGLFVTEGTDECVSSGIEARNVFGSGHIAPDLAFFIGAVRTVILCPNRLFVIHEAALTQAVALGFICAVNFCFRVRNEIERAGGIAVIGEGNAPEFVFALVGNENTNRARDILIGQTNGGEARRVIAGVIGVTVIEGKTEQAPISACFRNENISVGNRLHTSAHGVLTNRFAKTNLRSKAYIFIVEHVVIPMTGRFGLRDGIGIVCVKMTVPFEFCHNKNQTFLIK